MNRGVRSNGRLGPGLVLVRGAALVALISVAAGCASSTESDGPTAGGTLTYLTTSYTEFFRLDPQRMFLPEDVAFTTTFLQRTLTAYSYDADPAEVDLVADLATDTGTTNDDATEWSFTLRDGPTFEDGSAITCADVKFGVSRAFDPESILATGLLRSVRLLDVPMGADGMTPAYAGPYVADPGDVAAFDRAVSCSADDRTITFRLAQPAADFGHAVSTPTFAPVPEDTPAGAGYDRAPVSSGPYRIDSYDSAERLVLVRNDAWDRDTDPLRPAYPDRIEVEFAIDPRDIEARLTADGASDQAAVGAPFDTSTAATLGADQALVSRTVTGQELGTDYLAINTQVVPEPEHRRAIAAAVDRAALHEALGGDATGLPAAGLLPPGLIPDGTSTVLDVPPSGDPEAARALLADAGTPMPPLSFAYMDTPMNHEAATVLRESLDAAGIALETVPMGLDDYYPAILAPESPYALMLGAWAPPWMDATRLTDLLTPAGGTANLSRYDDPAFTADAEAAAAELDDDVRDEAWAELDARAVADAVVVPLRFDQQVRLVGSQVRDARAWAPYGSVAFGAMWLEPAG